MPKKRAKKRKTARTSPVKRALKTSRKKQNKSTKRASVQNKVSIILRNLILFGILFILSVILYNLFRADGILSDFFWFLALITGVIAVAFVIAYLVFFFLRILKK